MNRRVVWLAVGLAVVVFSTAVHAQQQRRGQRGRGIGGFAMTLAQVVSSEAVQKEVGMTDEQRAEVREAAAEGRGQRMSREELQNASAEERQALLAKRQEAAQKVDAKIAEILKPEQLARAKGIRLQALGTVGALRDPDVVKALGITEEQQEKINTAAREVMQELGGGGATRGNFAQMREKMEAQMKERTKGLLSDEQNAELKKMLGAPFDVSQLRAGQRGRGRGRQTDN